MIELRQKSLFEKHRFVLHEDYIHVFYKDQDGENEFKFDYDDITHSRRSKKQQSPRMMYAAISFTSFAVIGFVLVLFGMHSAMRYVPIWFIGAIVFWSFYFLTIKRYVLLDLTGEHRAIFFLKNKPSQDKLNKFIEQIYENRKVYLKKYYSTHIPTNDPKNELSKFEWLLREGVITTSDFEEAKNKILYG